MLLLSIHPQFAEAILNGTKSVEFRRRKPLRCDPGTRLLIYSSSPTCALVGTATIDEVQQDTPRKIWQACGRFGGISYPFYNTYFDSCKAAVGICLSDPKRLDHPVPLNVLRVLWPGFHPPQQFAYLDLARLIEVENMASKKSHDLAVA